MARSTRPLLCAIVAMLAIVDGGGVLAARPAAAPRITISTAGSREPGLVKRVGARLSRLVFSEKSGERKLEERVGVRTFSKYWINGGSFWTKQKWWPLRLVHGTDRAAIEEYVAMAKTLETIHLVEGSLLLGLNVHTYASGHSPYVLVPMALNLVANAYPILSNRYNRHRAERLLLRMDTATPKAE